VIVGGLFWLFGLWVSCGSGCYMRVFRVGPYGFVWVFLFMG
jgi:hypothetical protein